MYEVAALVISLILVLIVVLAIYVKPKYTTWSLRKQMLDDLDSRYESLRKMRKELIYHIDWARERGDRADALKLEPEIDRIDGELVDIKKQYQEIESGRKIPSKSL